MLEFISQFFSSQNFMPHGHCYLWRPDLLWSMVVGNAVIAISYFSIPVALLIAMRHRKYDKLKWILMMFGVFIFACGTTHLIDIYTIWNPVYWLEAVAKLSTATVSAITAIALWPIVGRAKAYITNQELTNESLVDSNSQLQNSISSLRREHFDFQTLNRMSGYLQVCNDIKETGKTIVETLSRLWPETSGALYLASGDEQRFSLAGNWGDARHLESIQSHCCWAYRLARPFPEDDDQTQFGCSAAGCGVAAEKICLPITAGGKTFGLLHLANIELPLDDRTRSILPLLIERAGFAIYSMCLRQSLEFKSTRDSLTELYNRRYLDESLEIEINRAQRDQSELSVVMFDLDHFKRLNDSFGHEAGDEALRVFAEILHSSLRAGDIACRYGGEEFVLILPGAELEQALDIAERIRVALAQKSGATDAAASLANLTVSAGVASSTLHGHSTEKLLAAADHALYRAKDAGRNQVQAADGGAVKAAG